MTGSGTSRPEPVPDAVPHLARQRQQFGGRGPAAVGEGEHMLAESRARPLPYPLVKPACSISQAALVLTRPSAAGKRGAPAGSRLGRRRRRGSDW